MNFAASRSMWLLAALLALGACTGPEAVVSTCPVGEPAAGRATVTGVVSAPWSYYATSPIKPAQALQEVPVPGAVVALTDVAGRPVPGFEATRTDEFGAFSLGEVPQGAPFVLTAVVQVPKGPELRMLALVRPGATRVQLGVNTASTLLVRTLTRDRKGLLADFHPEAYEQAVEALRLGLTNGNMPDLTRPAEAEKALEQWSQGNGTLSAALATLRQDFARNPIAPTPTPSPDIIRATPTPTPSSNDSRERTPAPTPTPRAALEATIAIRNFQFVPGEVVVRQYGTVVFVNEDGAPHRVLPLGESGFMQPYVVEAGMQSLPIYFDQPGTYQYTDSFYPAMHGTIIVQPGPPPATPTPAPSVTPGS